MKVGDAGECFFVIESDEPVPEEYATSPLISSQKPTEAMLANLTRLSLEDQKQLRSNDSSVAYPLSDSEIEYMASKPDKVKTNDSDIKAASALNQHRSHQLGCLSDSEINYDLSGDESTHSPAGELGREKGSSAAESSSFWSWGWGKLPKQKSKETASLPSTPEAKKIDLNTRHFSPPFPLQSPSPVAKSVTSFFSPKEQIDNTLSIQNTASSALASEITYTDNSHLSLPTEPPSGDDGQASDVSKSASNGHTISDMPLKSTIVGASYQESFSRVPLGGEEIPSNNSSTYLPQDDMSHGEKSTFQGNVPANIIDSTNTQSQETTGWNFWWRKSTSSTPPEAETSSAALSSFNAEEKKPDHFFYKSLRLSSEQLRSLNLKRGPNTVIFTTSRGASCSSRIFYWPWDSKIVISDIDGTITKSDVLGHLYTMVGKDWTHSGVARLYSSIKASGYEILYLTSRAIGQADYTRFYLKNVEQESFNLPDGPVIMSPDRLLTAFHREVILRRPDEFKIACLKDIRRLFEQSGNPFPFFAGFGNRNTDSTSYLAVGIPSSRIFIINSSGEVRLQNLGSTYQSSYPEMDKLADLFFPPIAVSHVAASYAALRDDQWSDWHYWWSFPSLLDEHGDTTASPSSPSSINGGCPESGSKSPKKMDRQSILSIDLSSATLESPFVEQVSTSSISTSSLFVLSNDILTSVQQESEGEEAAEHPYF